MKRKALSDFLCKNVRSKTLSQHKNSENIALNF